MSPKFWLRDTFTQINSFVRTNSLLLSYVKETCQIQNCVFFLSFLLLLLLLFGCWYLYWPTVCVFSLNGTYCGCWFVVAERGQIGPDQSDPLEQKERYGDGLSGGIVGFFYGWISDRLDIRLCLFLYDLTGTSLSDGSDPLSSETFGWTRGRTEITSGPTRRKRTTTEAVEPYTQICLYLLTREVRLLTMSPIKFCRKTPIPIFTYTGPR